MTDQPPLTDEQYEILKHTVKNGRYCGGGTDTDQLAARGLLLYLGKPAWCPDPYYAITGTGQEAIRQHQYSQPQSGKPHKPTQIPPPPWT